MKLKSTSRCLKVTSPECYLCKKRDLSSMKSWVMFPKNIIACWVMEKIIGFLSRTLMWSLIGYFYRTDGPFNL